MSKDQEIKSDLLHIRRILKTVRSPYDRYQLTLLFEIAARMFASGSVPRSETPEKAQRPCNRKKPPYLH